MWWRSPPEAVPEYEIVGVLALPVSCRRELVDAAGEGFEAGFGDEGVDEAGDQV